MNEVEKLYENAGVKQSRMCEWTCKDSVFCSQNCQHYKSTKLHYPPFTAEKQLNIIKWLMKNNKDYQYDTYCDTYWFIIDDDRECKKYQKFDEALAELLNLYWQDFDEEERNSIKEILND